jgi:hypothetical protein
MEKLSSVGGRPEMRLYPSGLAPKPAGRPDRAPSRLSPRTTGRLEPVVQGIPLDAWLDEAKHGGHGPDSRDPLPITKPRDMYEPDLHIDTIKLKARNFR